MVDVRKGCRRNAFYYLCESTGGTLLRVEPLGNCLLGGPRAGLRCGWARRDPLLQERGGVLPQVIGASSRDMRSTRMVFKDGIWAIDEAALRIGIRQGCSLPPVIFRWTTEETRGEVGPIWRQAGSGSDLDGVWKACTFWAGDSRILAVDGHIGRWSRWTI